MLFVCFFHDNHLCMSLQQCISVIRQVALTILAGAEGLCVTG